jgi:hypothetical protein
MGVLASLGCLGKSSDSCGLRRPSARSVPRQVRVKVREKGLKQVVFLLVAAQASNDCTRNCYPITLL